MLGILIQNSKLYFLWLLFFLLLGAVAAFRLPVQFMPDVNNRSIDVLTVWQSATPQEVESQILEPQEEVLDGIAGLKRSNAYAARGTSWLSLEFDSSVNMEETLIDVVGRIGRVANMPRTALPPQILIGGEYGGMPTLTTFYLQTSERSDPNLDIQSVVEKVVQPKLESLDGVARVYAARGLGAEEEIYVTFDPFALARFELQLRDLTDALDNSFDISGGFIDLSRRRYNMRYVGKVSVDEMSELIVGWRRDTPILLRDVAQISIDRPNAADITYVDGKRAVALNVQRERGASSLDTIAALKAAANELNDTTLSGMGLELRHTYDTSQMIGSAIQFVIQNIGFGLLLSILPVWLFFRNGRTTLVIAVAIPASIIITFIILAVGGRTLNVISLAGLAFATGMVLDASIVVLESIIARRNAGDNADKAAKVGTNKVVWALIASTITTVSVFSPVLLINESEVQIFVDLAFTIAASVVISLLVAITLIPILSTKLVHELKVDAWQALWQRWAAMLSRLTNTQLKCWTIVTVLVGGSVALVPVLMPSSDYLPALKQNQVNVSFYLPSGTNPKYVNDTIIPLIDKRVSHLLKADSTVPIKNYTVSMQSSFSMSFTAQPLNPEDAVRLEQLLRDEIFTDMPDLWTYVNRPSAFQNLRAMDTLELYFQGSDMALLSKSAAEAMEAIQAQMPTAAVYPGASFSPTEIELSVIPNTARMSQLGFTRAEVIEATQAFGNGLYLQEYFDGNRRRNIVLRGEPWENFEQLKAYPVMNSQDLVVPLGELVEITQTFGPAVIQHVNLDRTFILTVEPPAGMSLEDLQAKLQSDVVANLQRALPEGYAINYGGSADSIRKVKSQMLDYFVFSVCLLFLIMAGLFRSIKASLIVLLTVPLATVGGAGLLKLLNVFVYQPLDIITMIGFIILLGLVVNNAILLVYGVRAHENEGKSRAQAVELSIESRLRPILLSTITSVFGMLPLLLLPGTGSEIYRGLAAAIVGGMLFSGAFTLLLLPAVLRLQLFGQIKSRTIKILNKQES
nr:efflux RND transporter permease subunit [Pseudoalteromonas rubra]